MNQPPFIAIEGHTYDPETIDLLREVLDAVWLTLDEAHRNDLPRSLMAQRLLLAASTGERNRDVLKQHALGLQTTLAPGAP